MTKKLINHVSRIREKHATDAHYIVIVHNIVSTCKKTLYYVKRGKENHRGDRGEVIKPRSKSDGSVWLVDEEGKNPSYDARVSQEKYLTFRRETGLCALDRSIAFRFAANRFGHDRHTIT